MTEEPTPVGQEIVVPPTGELLPLDGPSDQLAEAVARMRELEVELARVRSIVGGELARRLDLENLRSVKVGRYEVSVGAPGVKWDADKLSEVLTDLVSEGAITAGAADRIVVTSSVRKTSVRELNKLLPNLLPEQVARVTACSEPDGRARIAKVS